MSVRPFVYRWAGVGLLVWTALNSAASDGHGVAATTPVAKKSLPAGSKPDHAHGNGESTNTASPASQIDALISTNLLKLKHSSPKATVDRNALLQAQLEYGRELRRKKDMVGATRQLVELLKEDVPPEFKRGAMFELAQVAHDEGNLSRAQQVYAQYLQQFGKDPSVPEVLLRQGLIYRQMGANQLAISKFYAVMSSALNMQLDQLDYYSRLVLQAQTEIADTHLAQGQFRDAEELYVRLLKQKNLALNQAQIRFKLLRSLESLEKMGDVAAQAEVFETNHADAPELPEVRFMHAQALRKLGRMRESLEQIFLLLDSQQAQEEKSPENWLYWRQRIGNGIANQLYQEGDYLNSLLLYTRLAELDSSPGWQLPAWYQMGLIHERLQQPQLAVERYDAILGREKELAGVAYTPGLRAVIDMTKWRRDHLAWQSKAELAMQSLKLESLRRPSFGTNTAEPSKP
jgi:tetratricopeptide (TPR) repeat protein